MVVYPDRMRENLERSRGVVFSGTVLLELAERGVSREQAYEWVQRNAMRSFAEQRDFKDSAAGRPDVTRCCRRRDRACVRSRRAVPAYRPDFRSSVRVAKPEPRPVPVRRELMRARVFRHVETIGVRSAGPDDCRRAALAGLRRRRGRSARQVLRARSATTEAAQAKALAAEVADKLLANPVIESYRIEVGLT